MTGRAIPLEFHPTEQFLADLDLVAGDSALQRAAVGRVLGGAMTKLEKEGPGIATPHGGMGQNFSVPLTKEHILVFRWETSCDGEGRPLKEHLFLLTIERA